jgi:hypothetical protein
MHGLSIDKNLYTLTQYPQQEEETTVPTEYTNIKLPTSPYVEKVDLLVAKQLYSSRTDVIKDALRDFFEKYPETKISTSTEA